jgi:hypothetical protein
VKTNIYAAFKNKGKYDEIKVHHICRSIGWNIQKVSGIYCFGLAVGINE